MDILLNKASDWKWKEARSIASLEDLEALLDEFPCGLIIHRAEPGDTHSVTATIYDSYVE